MRRRRIIKAVDSIRDVALTSGQATSSVHRYLLGKGVRQSHILSQEGRRFVETHRSVRGPSKAFGAKDSRT